MLGLELTLDRVALGGDRVDRVAFDLFEEVRAERHRHPWFAGRGSQEEDRQQVDHEQREDEPQKALPAVRRGAARRLLGHAAPVGGGGDLPAAFVARQRRMGVARLALRRSASFGGSSGKTFSR